MQKNNYSAKPQTSSTLQVLGFLVASAECRTRLYRLIVKGTVGVSQTNPL